MHPPVVRDRIWAAYEAGDLVPACAWCNRVRIDDEWVQPPFGSLGTIDQAMTLSHSICPTCATSIAAS